jgi:hypothetical protein
VHRRYERSELQLFSLLKWPLTFIDRSNGGAAPEYAEGRQPDLLNNLGFSASLDSRRTPIRQRLHCSNNSAP